MHVVNTAIFSILQGDYQNSSKNLIAFSFSNPVSFYEHNYEKHEGPGTNYLYICKLSNISFFTNPITSQFRCFNPKTAGRGSV